MKLKRGLELLSPAGNADIAIDAILHGADAVYMGATSHGARVNAANSLDDIARVVDFAHRFRAKVYVTVNTIIYEAEIRQVEILCRDLYHIGVDALIVQDMAMLRMNLPPIPLHASTQCDIRTPEKAKFLEGVGFSQLVLARELTLNEIKEITNCVTIPVECFIHGALCVSYSGRCHASHISNGRSANRGECSQVCRLKYNLYDASGKILAKEKYLLSLKDFNLSQKLNELIEVGVSSFKIEGRLKDMAYVKNITSFYNNKLNEFIGEHKQDFKRNSFGRVEYGFTPNPHKSFNRGFTDYFIANRKPLQIASLLTPKSLGERIDDVSKLRNGDGISFFDRNDEFQGVNVNKIENGKIIPARKIDIPKNVVLYRTNDLEWEKQMAKETAKRKIGLKIRLDNSFVAAEDERGVKVILPLDVKKEVAHNPMNYLKDFGRLGNTIYELRDYENCIDEKTFIPKSEISRIRRNLVSLLDHANNATYKFDYRRKENKEIIFLSNKLDFRDNVANSLAESFYREHGVKHIEPAIEIQKRNKSNEIVAMTTRHCILRELGMCKKEKGSKAMELKYPLEIKSGAKKFKLRFNCDRCEMELLANR